MTIKQFSDIPDILSMEIQTIDYVVPALNIARKTVTLWAGSDGIGKTILAQRMAVDVARGEEFLGMRCEQANVLYIDLENPDFEVQRRLRAMAGEDETIPNLRVWGKWIDQSPDGDLLLKIAEATKPLVIFDPLRLLHALDENDSTEMASVMRRLRAIASAGAAVIIIHHLAKSENSTSRGSSVIHGHSDLAFLHTLDKETSLITLKVDKNRHGASHQITIKADFEEANFEVVEAPWVGARNHQLQKLEQIIRENPGSNQKEICTRAGWMKAKVLSLLNQGLGTLWQMKRGPKNSKLFYPAGEGVELFCCSTTKKVEQQNSCSNPPTSLRTTENNTEQQAQQKHQTDEPQDLACSESLRTTENNSNTNQKTVSGQKISPFTGRPYPPRFAKYRWESDENRP